jgi:hypothetical protein
VLQRGHIEEELLAVQLHVEILEQPVGLDIVKHVRLPEQHHVLVVGIDLLVHALVQRRVAEVDRAALAEIPVKEVVQFLKKLVAESRERFQRGVDVLLKLWEHALGVIPGLDLHQIDVARFPLNLRAHENIAQNIEKSCFSGHNVMPSVF